MQKYCSCSQIDDLQHKIKQLQSREHEAQEAAGRIKKECSTTSLDTESKMLKMQEEHLEQSNRLHEVGEITVIIKNDEFLLLFSIDIQV